jgi:hypothetical protein
MSDHEFDRDLRADLGALRGALQEVRAAELDEQRLLVAVRARRAAAGQAVPARGRAAAPRAAQRARAPLALAAAAAFAAVTAMITLRVGPGPERPAASAATDAPAFGAAAASAADGADAFRPLAFSSGLSAGQSYSVVRVRIPVTALAPGYAASPDATIEAELLVGEDGLASGIRFNRDDTLFVSAPSNDSGEHR